MSEEYQQRNFIDEQESHDWQAGRYKQSLVRFVEKFREGKAGAYGVNNILNTLLDQNSLPTTMTGAWETELSQQEKRQIADEVVAETGFTRQEAEAGKRQQSSR